MPRFRGRHSYSPLNEATGEQRSTRMLRRSTLSRVFVQKAGNNARAAPFTIRIDPHYATVYDDLHTSARCRFVGVFHVTYSITTCYSLFAHILAYLSVDRVYVDKHTAMCERCRQALCALRLPEL